MSFCSNLSTCGFIKKYGETKALELKGYLRKYCNGEKQDKCERKRFKKNYGITPSENMTPIGMYFCK